MSQIQWIKSNEDRWVEMGDGKIFGQLILSSLDNRFMIIQRPNGVYSMMETLEGAGVSQYNLKSIAECKAKADELSDSDSVSGKSPWIDNLVQSNVIPRAKSEERMGVLDMMKIMKHLSIKIESCENYLYRIDRTQDRLAERLEVLEGRITELENRSDLSIGVNAKL